MSVISDSWQISCIWFFSCPKLLRLLWVREVNYRRQNINKSIIKLLFSVIFFRQVYLFVWLFLIIKKTKNTQLPVKSVYLDEGSSYTLFESLCFFCFFSCQIWYETRDRALNYRLAYLTVFFSFLFFLV